VAVASAGPYANLHIAPEITTPAPHRSVFLQAGCPSCQPTNSVKALKEIYKNAISILQISNHNSFRMLLDKNASVYFI